MTPFPADAPQVLRPGSLPSFLLCHGFTGSRLDFAPLQAELPYTVLGVDLPGHGLNSHRSSVFPSFEQTSRALASMTDPDTILLGYSLGGRIALDAVVRQEAHPRALILVGASPGLRDDAERRARALADEALAQRILSDGLDEFLAYWNRLPLIQTQTRILEPYRENMQRRRHNNTSEGLAASLRHHGTGRMPSLWSTLSSVKCPVLLITGELDLKFCIIAKTMAPLLDTVRHVEIGGAGHCAHLENPIATAAAINAFLIDQRVIGGT